MRSLVVVLGLAVLACGSSESPPAPVANPPAPPPAAGAARLRPACKPSVSCAVAMTVYFKDVMCTCTTKECGERTHKEMSAWADDFARAWDRNEKSSEAQEQQIADVSRELSDCTTRVMTSGSDGAAAAVDPAEPLAPVQPHQRVHPVGPKPTTKPSCKQGESSTKCALVMMSYFTDAMCSCATSACAQTVTDEMTKWAQEVAAKMDKNDGKPSDAEIDAFQTVGTRLSECTTDAMLATP